MLHIGSLDEWKDARMAKLHFFYSVMNAGKSTQLLAAAHNYSQNGGRPLLLTSSVDNRAGVGVISSRIGISAEAQAISDEDDLFRIVEAEHRKEPVTAVLMDEVQFMTADHVRQASEVVDKLGIPVMAYGLKNNVLGTLFSESIAVMLALADKICEIKQVCHCGRKATMILRYGRDGTVDRNGPIVEIGGEGRYVSVCRRHWKVGDIGPAARKLIGMASNETT